MKNKKGLFLFLALLLPGCVFVFLKVFGKNEFAVAPLFQEAPPGGVPAECGPIAFPYHMPDSAISRIAMGTDSIVLLVLGAPNKEGQTQLKRMDDELGKTPIRRISIAQNTPQFDTWRKCIFLLPASFDLVLIDKTGAIRGQYAANDREEMDRLLTELTIIFRKY